MSNGSSKAFALLAARIRNKLDDEFPELTDALLQILYPHYLAPLPSFSIVQFVIDPDKGKLTAGHKIERGQTLLSQAVGGTPCRFRTCLPGNAVAHRGGSGPIRRTRPAESAGRRCRGH